MRDAIIATFVALVVGCGASSSSPPPETGPIVLTRVRADLVCTEEIPSGEADCVARGCGWSAPLFCSGIQHEREITPDPTRPCTCVCQADIRDCMSRP